MHIHVLRRNAVCLHTHPYGLQGAAGDAGEPVALGGGQSQRETVLLVEIAQRLAAFTHKYGAIRDDSVYVHSKCLDFQQFLLEFHLLSN